MTIATHSYPEQLQQEPIPTFARRSVRVRIIRTGDRALIYTTVAGLQAAGLAYRGCRASRFLIVETSDDERATHPQHVNNAASARVYLTSPADVVACLPREELDTRAEEWHWDALHCLFAELASNSRQSTDSQCMISHGAAHPTRIAAFTFSTLDPNNTEARLLILLPRLGKCIYIPTIPLVPSELMLSTGMHQHFGLKKRSMPSPPWLTGKQEDLASYVAAEDGDGPLRLRDKTAIRNSSALQPLASVLSTGMHSACLFLPPSSAMYSTIDSGPGKQSGIDHRSIEIWDGLQ
ncbi:hypothetical protein D9619_008978 [Psilocybe cf. subviscida]|uniref:Uncharacterized protein n=1 Tax=Psilocybe cf. subviscida TaxID=2480587 RepID=A0A8H5FA67_9AGAR|nr:hypothetical protein D9619_008978 [Psilocybe cf. subviscida]